MGKSKGWISVSLIWRKKWSVDGVSCGGDKYCMLLSVYSILACSVWIYTSGHRQVTNLRVSADQRVAPSSPSSSWHGISTAIRIATQSMDDYRKFILQESKFTQGWISKDTNTKNTEMIPHTLYTVQIYNIYLELHYVGKGLSMHEDILLSHQGRVNWSSSLQNRTFW